MDSLGDQLKAAREARGATLSQAAAATRIKVQSLEAMELNDFSQIAAATYARGFIKIYAEYLELEPAPLIDEYMRLHSPDGQRLATGEEVAPGQSGLRVAGEGALSVAGSSPAAWPPWLTRIVLPVAAIVLAVVVTARLAGGSDPDTAGGIPGKPAKPIYIAEPPEPYLSAGERPGLLP